MNASLTKPTVRVDKTKVFVYRNSACVAALTNDERLVLVRQFRDVHGLHTLELPGGTVDDGETDIGAAIREIAEETGIRVEDAERLFVLDLDFSASFHKTAVYFSRLSLRSESLNKDERIVLVNLAEAAAMCLDGRITHAPTVAATFAIWYKNNAGKST